MAMTCRFKSDGKSISLFGYGAMRYPTVDGGHACDWIGTASDRSVDMPRVKAQVKRLLDGGVTYFDTAPCYCRGKSEGILGEALAASGYSRDSYVIATKLSNFSGEYWPLAKCKEMFENSLKQLRTDYIDNYQLHSIGNTGMEGFRQRFLDNGALEWLKAEREAKRIRNLGFSFHGDIKTFDWCMDHYDEYQWDFAMIQVNYVDWIRKGNSSTGNRGAQYLYDELAKRNIPAVVMEPLLGGTLARYNAPISRELAPLDPSASLASWAFRFCGSLPNVMCVLSGVTYEEHIEENLRTFSPLKPLSAAEFAALERAAKAYLTCGTIDCTACNYCMPCPYGIDIPTLLAFRNRYLTGERRPAHEVLAAYEKAIPEPLRRAEHCTGCGRCLGHCPQRINIDAEIMAIDKAIDQLKMEIRRK